MPKNIKKEVSKHKDVSYTNKDFGSFKNGLRRYIATHFSDSVVDVSDNSAAGMLVDVAAYVGDVMTYYLDHQFNENSIETAVESENIERFVREAGLEISGPSPAIVEVTFRIRVPAEIVEGEYVPSSICLPVIKRETIVSSISGVSFTLMDDLDFTLVKDDGSLSAKYKIGQLSSGVPLNFILELKGVCTSSVTETETFTFGEAAQPFRKVTLGKTDVTEIITVYDTDGDDYYEVESLTQDTVFKRAPNSRKDSEYAPERLLIYHAPKRFITTREGTTGKTILRFGSGDEQQFDEDIIPDPSEHSVTLYGDRQTTSKITIDPNSFLNTQTLGISPRNTTLTIKYRYGGGVRHNVESGLINSVDSLITSFKAGCPTSTAAAVRASAVVTNDKPAGGGEDEPNIEELRTLAILNKSSQNRIVTREDLLARVYMMPTNFGRVYRVSVRDNPNNPQAAQLHIISRASNKTLMLSPDTLKQNLGNYLSKFRIVSDAIDILDASIANIGINFSVTILADRNPDTVLNLINLKLYEYFDIKNWQIDQPIIVSELENIILNTSGVVGVMSLNFVGKSGTIERLVYSDYSYDPRRFMDRGILFPPRGGMFEVKFPNEDIVGRVT